jgi:hypothetical protein
MEREKTEAEPLLMRVVGTSGTARALRFRMSPVKRRLLITGLVVAALVLALYGVIFGTGMRPAST